MTKKDKLDQFDALKDERDMLYLAMFDTVCKGSKFPFVDTVKVDASDIDSTYKKGEFVVSIAVSKRCIPVYRVLTDTSVELYTESDLIGHGIVRRMIKHGIWLMGSKVS